MSWTNEMTHQVKALSVKPKDLSSNLKTQTVQKENLFLQVLL